MADKKSKSAIAGFFKNLLQRFKKQNNKDVVLHLTPYKDPTENPLNMEDDDSESVFSEPDYSSDEDAETKISPQMKMLIKQENKILLIFVVGEWVLKFWAALFYIALDFKLGCAFLLFTGFLGLFIVTRFDRRQNM